MLRRAGYSRRYSFIQSLYGLRSLLLPCSRSSTGNPRKPGNHKVLHSLAHHILHIFLFQFHSFFSPVRVKKGLLSPLFYCFCGILSSLMRLLCSFIVPHSGTLWFLRRAGVARNRAGLAWRGTAQGWHGAEPRRDGMARNRAGMAWRGTAQGWHGAEPRRAKSWLQKTHNKHLNADRILPRQVTIGRYVHQLILSQAVADSCKICASGLSWLLSCSSRSPDRREENFIFFFAGSTLTEPGWLPGLRFLTVI